MSVLNAPQLRKAHLYKAIMKTEWQYTKQKSRGTALDFTQSPTPDAAMWGGEHDNYFRSEYQGARDRCNR